MWPEDCFPCLENFLKLGGDGGFSGQYKRQGKQIHVIAHFLFPQHGSQTPSNNWEDQIYSGLIDEYTQPENREKACEEYLSFQNQLQPFKKSRRCWERSQADRMMMMKITDLGKLVVRVFSDALANSVPSEQAFSTQNTCTCRFKLNPTTLSFPNTPADELWRFGNAIALPKIPDHIMNESNYSPSDANE
jgi:hypothetical protein